MINASCSITIFNGILDKESRRTVYLPTFIDGVSWHESEAVHGETGAFSESGSVKIRIPVTAKVDGGKRFVAHSDFSRMPLDEASGYWTISNEDVVLQGRIDCAEPVYNALIDLKKYGRTVQITSYADNTQRGSTAIRHWRIGGV